MPTKNNVGLLLKDLKMCHDTEIAFYFCDDKLINYAYIASRLTIENDKSTL